MGHRAELYGAIKLSAEHWQLFPLHRPLYPLLTTVPPWHSVVFKNIFIPLKLSCHLYSAPQAEGYYSLSCGCMRSFTWNWNTVFSWDSRYFAMMKMYKIYLQRSSGDPQQSEVERCLHDLQLRKTKHESRFQCYQKKEMGDKLNGLLKSLSGRALGSM